MRLFRFLLSLFFWGNLFISNTQTQIQNFSADFVNVDPYGNIYAVSGTQLAKFSLNGELLNSYSNPKFGIISSIDVCNPMKLFLFFADAGLLVFLNEQLTPITEPLNLFNANYYTISLASYSTANQIHLFDNAEQYLITLDYNLRELSKTPLNFDDFYPTQMIELEEKNLVLINPSTGVYFFDAFGTFTKSLKITTKEKIGISSDEIYYLVNDELVIYNYKKLQEKRIIVSEKNAKQVVIFRNKMIVLQYDGVIQIY